MKTYTRNSPTDTPPARHQLTTNQAPSSLRSWSYTCTGPVCTGAGAGAGTGPVPMYVPVPVPRKERPGRCLIAHAHAYNVPMQDSSVLRVVVAVSSVVTPRRIARQVCQVSRPPTCEKLAEGDTAEICPWRKDLLRIPSAPQGLVPSLALIIVLCSRALSGQGRPKAPG